MKRGVFHMLIRKMAQYRWNRNTGLLQATGIAEKVPKRAELSERTKQEANKSIK